MSTTPSSTATKEEVATWLSTFEEGRFVSKGLEGATGADLHRLEKKDFIELLGSPLLGASLYAVFNPFGKVVLPTIESYVGATPLVRTQRLLPPESSNILYLKLEGNNPAGSVKDRPALSMIQEAEKRGEIKPGDTLIEATSGNTGIALAMVAAIKGYKLILIMPENQTIERRATMTAYGAELILVTVAEGMEGARDLALKMESEGKGKVLNQFANPDNPLAHYRTTGPEIWQATEGKITHFITAMGTTGTIMGVSRYLKEMNPNIQVIGVQPETGSQIAGIRKWPPEYLPKIFDRSRLDGIMEVSKTQAETTTRRLAKEEGVFCGLSSGGAITCALQLAEQVKDAVIVSMVYDRGDRYLSTPLFH